ncbi:MAG: membrane protein insertase YidC, partial [Candidatus Sulfotelmatobacter sp.]
MPEYQNPQQEPGSERRLLLVFLLTFIVLIFLEPLLKKYGPQPPAQPHPTQPAPAQPAAAPSSPAAAVSVPAPPPPPTAAKQASAETETVIDSDLYRITFTNRGAQVKSWILKKFKNDAQTGPLDLVNPEAASKFGDPLSLWTYDETVRNRLNSALYVPSKEGNLASPAQLSFEYADRDLVVRKTFHFDNTYLLKIDTSVFYKGAEIFAAPAWPAGFGDQVT